MRLYLILIFIGIPFIVFCQSEIDPKSVTSDFYQNHDVSQYKLFLEGEVHFKKENAIASIACLKYLYEKANVRVVLFESGYGEGFLLNQYLKSGDERLFDKINLFTRETDYYRALRKFYLTPPDNDKFTVVGVDFDIDLNFFPALSFVMPDKSVEAPLEIKPFIDSFYVDYENMRFKNIFPQDNYKDFEFAYDTRLYRKYIYEFFCELRTKETYYQKYFGEKFYDFKKIVESQMFSPFIRPRGMEKKYKYHIRELYLYNNILEVMKRYPNVGYEARFGNAHISKKHAKKWAGLSDWTSFAARLENNLDSPIKGKVISCFIFNDIAIKVEKTDYVDRKLLKKELKKLGYGEVKMIPYENEKHFNNQVKYFDYIILVGLK